MEDSHTQTLYIAGVCMADRTISNTGTGGAACGECNTGCQLVACVESYVCG